MAFFPGDNSRINPDQNRIPQIPLHEQQGQVGGHSVGRGGRNNSVQGLSRRLSTASLNTLSSLDSQQGAAAARPNVGGYPDTDSDYERGGYVSHHEYAVGQPIDPRYGKIGKEAGIVNRYRPSSSDVQYDIQTPVGPAVPDYSENLERFPTFDPKSKDSIKAFLSHPKVLPNIKQRDGNYIYVDEGNSRFIFIPGKDWDKATSIKVTNGKTKQDISNLKDLEMCICKFSGSYERMQTDWSERRAPAIRSALNLPASTPVQMTHFVLNFKRQMATGFPPFGKHEATTRHSPTVWRRGTKVSVPKDMWTDDRGLEPANLKPQDAPFADSGARRKHGDGGAGAGATPYGPYGGPGMAMPNITVSPIIHGASVTGPNVTVTGNNNGGAGGSVSFGDRDAYRSRRAEPRGPERSSDRRSNRYDPYSSSSSDDSDDDDDDFGVGKRRFDPGYGREFDNRIEEEIFPPPPPYSDDWQGENSDEEDYEYNPAGGIDRRGAIRRQEAYHIDDNSSDEDEIRERFQLQDNRRIPERGYGIDDSSSDEENLRGIPEAGRELRGAIRKRDGDARQAALRRSFDDSSEDELQQLHGAPLDGPGSKNALRKKDTSKDNSASVRRQRFANRDSGGGDLTTTLRRSREHLNRVYSDDETPIKQGVKLGEVIRGAEGRQQVDFPPFFRPQSAPVPYAPAQQHLPQQPVAQAVTQASDAATRRKAFTRTGLPKGATDNREALRAARGHIERQSRRRGENYARETSPELKPIIQKYDQGRVSKRKKSGGSKETAV